MKQQITSFVLATFLALAQAAKEEEATKRDLNAVITPTFTTGLITVFFLYVMLAFGYGQLMDIQTPPYQL